MAERFRINVDDKKRLVLPAVYAKPESEYSIEMREWYVPKRGHISTEHPFLRIKPYEEEVLPADEDVLGTYLAYRRGSCTIDKARRMALKIEELKHAHIEVGRVEDDLGVLILVLGEGEMDIWSPGMYLGFIKRMSEYMAPRIEGVLREHMDREVERQTGLLIDSYRTREDD
jgi:DNA-binding transcriptional regulator/RsmH inhibitor MraZ